MTYRTSSGRQMIVAATGGGEDAALVAFAIPASSSNIGIDSDPSRGGK
jgi:hypothetical protein